MKTYLEWPDYLVFSIVLVGSAAIGVVYSLVGGGQKTTEEFLMAGRNMGTIPVTLSLLVSFQSAIMILGFSNEMYFHGVQFLMMSISLILSMLITSFLFLPLFRRIKITSTFEYLERRYHSRSVRIFGGVLGSLSSVLYMGTASFAPSVAINAVTGFPIWASIIIVTGVSTFYTTLGGIKAVLWTDVFQFFIMVAGIAGIIIKGFIVTDGNIWDTMRQGDRTQLFEWDADPRVRHTFWSIVFGGTLMWTTVYGTSQPSVQRFNTAATTSKARWAVLLNIPGFLVLAIPVSLCGMIVYTYYTNKGCDPLRMKYIRNGNQILPWFVMEAFEDVPGFTGLFMATLFSGALSSNSSTISGFTAVIWEDYVKPAIGKVEDWKATLINKIIVIVFGTLGAGVAFLCQFMGGPVTQVGLSFGGATLGPLMGIYLMGMFTTWTNWLGALFGGIIGSIVCFWVLMSSQILGVCSYNPPLPLVPIDGCAVQNMTNISATTVDYMTTTATNSSTVSNACRCCYTGPTYEGIYNLYAVSYLWYPVIGCMITIIVGQVVTLITGRMHSEDIDPNLLFPPLARFLDRRSRSKYNKGSKVIHSENELESLEIERYSDEI